MSNKAKVKKESTGNVFYPNSLDAFDNATYNFTLYMISPTDMKKRNYSANGKKIIAQSGVTQDMTIDNIEVASQPSINSRNGSGCSTLLNFTITEPMGASLFDKLNKFASELKIKNYHTALYFLELKFIGYETNGDYGGGLARNTWIWPTIITQINTTVNGSGSTYEIEASISGDIAYTDTFGTLKEAMSVQASNVGEALKSIGDQLKARQMAYQESYVGIPDEWIFEYEGNIDKYAIVPSTKSTSSSKMGSYSEKDPKGNTNVQFGDGTSITRMIESLIMSTEEFQKKAKNSGKADGRAKEEEQNPSKFSTLFRVYTDIILGEFDPVRGDYSKKMFYYIKEYDMISLAQEPEDIAKVSENNMSKIEAVDRIRKRYDYIFTGLNTQVLDIDLDFKFAFYTAVPTNASTNPDSKSQSAATIATTTETKRDAAFNKDLKTNVGDGKTKDSETGVGQNAITSSNSNKDTVTSVEDKFGTGKNILSSLFNQAKTGDMLTMDLTIKGDPYWLEPMPYVKDEGVVPPKNDKSKPKTFSLEAKIESEKNRSGEFVYTKDGDVYVLFNCGVPSVEAMFGGGRAVTEYNSLSGIYRVLTITSEFANGKFTQTLGVARITNIDVARTDIRKVK